jgi:hypothetical protein
MYDVYVAQLCGTIYAVRSNGRVIAKVPSGTDCSRLLKAAVIVPPPLHPSAAPLLRVVVLGPARKVT